MEATGTVKHTDRGTVIEVTEKEAKRIHAAQGGMCRGFVLVVGGQQYPVCDRGKPFDAYRDGEKKMMRYYYVDPKIA